MVLLGSAPSGFSKALLCNGESLEFDITGRTLGVGNNMTKYIGNAIRVGVVSMLTCGSITEVAYDVEDTGFKKFMSTKSIDELSGFISSSRAKFVIRDSGVIAEIAYNRLVFVFNPYAVTEMSILRELK